MRTWTKSVGAGLALIATCFLAPSAQAQRLAGEDLIEAIQDGGYYLVMRHAEAAVPTGGGGGRGGPGGFGGGRGGGRGGPPGGAPAGPPPEREEELTQESIGLLTGARHAFIAFELSLDAIYTSPALRATQQAAELPFAEITEVPEIGEGQSGAWLRQRVAEPHAAGSNTLIVTHFPVITNALDISSVDEGETLVVEPGGTIVGRLDLRDWSVLAVELVDF